MTWRLLASLPPGEKVKLIAYVIGKGLPVNTMNGIREFLRGKKAYITAVVGLLGAVVAWADGQIDTVALLAAAWAAAQTVFIRAGIANEVNKAQQ
ncbi:MAG: hypothetical protein BWX88_05130 [Planctomycetes bacterium ADurb.Bin126]|nr:MAG: hypothetical protein BWX88_05130 [Planctomycetes bacterium ADurb.Bin126]